MSASPSVIDSVRAFQKAQQTRKEILDELDTALNAFLAHSSNEADADADVTHAVNGSDAPAASCRSQEYEPPNEAQLNEIISIALQGLMDVREDVQGHQRALDESDDGRPFRPLVRQVEHAQASLAEQTIKTYQLQRLAQLQPETSFAESIALCLSSRSELEQQVAELLSEVSAELADML